MLVIVTKSQNRSFAIKWKKINILTLGDQTEAKTQCVCWRRETVNEYMQLPRAADARQPVG